MRTVRTVVLLDHHSSFSTFLNRLNIATENPYIKYISAVV